jgi:RNA polymerase sigma factor (sigma-70 family)
MAPPPQLERPTRRARLPSRLGRSAPARGSLVPLDRSSDERLARRATGGDGQALGAIFERYQQELYRFCLGLLGEPQDAQDALQNTMVKALRALPGEEREIALRPWLYRVAHNEAINVRRTRRATQTLDGHLLDAHASVAERAEHRERLQWLFRDLSDLPERQRAVLVMRELSGLDFADIGAALGTSGGVVRQTLYEARRNLEQMDSGRGMRCEAVTRVLSDADGRVSSRRQIRAHLRHCHDCRRFQDRIEARKEAFAGVALPPAALAGGLLQSALAGTGGSGPGGVTAALGGSAAKSAGTAVAMKAVATAAAVAIVGTVAVDRNAREHRATRDETVAPLSQQGHVASPAPSPAAKRRRPQQPWFSALGGPAVAAPSASADAAAPHRHRVSAMAAGHRVAPGQTVALRGESSPASGAVGESPPPTEATNSPPKPEMQPRSAKKGDKQEEKVERRQEHAAKAEAKAEEKAAKAEAKGKPEHGARPQHPAHPAHSQKPVFAPTQPEASSQENETTPVPEAEGSPEFVPQSPNGKAKGHEKQTSG